MEPPAKSFLMDCLVTIEIANRKNNSIAVVLIDFCGLADVDFGLFNCEVKVRRNAAGYWNKRISLVF